MRIYAMCVCGWLFARSVSSVCGWVCVQYVCECVCVRPSQYSHSMSWIGSNTRSFVGIITKIHARTTLAHTHYTTTLSLKMQLHIVFMLTVFSHTLPLHMYAHAHSNFLFHTHTHTCTHTHACAEPAAAARNITRGVVPGESQRRYHTRTYTVATQHFVCVRAVTLANETHARHVHWPV